MDYTKPRPELYNVPQSTDSFHGMPYRTLGRSGLRASVVGLGTWKFGYPHTGDGARVDEKTALAILDRAVELGVTFWDTANRYNQASGNSERIIGTWLKNNPDQRRNIVLATKIGGGMDGYSPNHGGLSRLNITEAVYASLARLGVDSIDLLYFHRFDPITPPEESLETVADLVQRGIIHYFGVSNFTVDQLKMYQAWQEGKGSRGRVIAVQNQFDILGGENPAHQGVLAHAAATGVSFIAHGPLRRGLLTDRYLDPNKVGPGDRLVDEGLMDSVKPEELEKVRRLAAIAREGGLTTSQLVLAYMLTLPGMGPVIPAASTVAQLEENARAGSVQLSDELITQIRAALQDD